MRLIALTLSILLGALLLQVETAVPKKDSCPGAPERPFNCDRTEVKNLCKDDAACKGKKKLCCPTYCSKMCTEPGPVKPGSCPVVKIIADCKLPIKKECDFDSNCLGKQKCCKQGCVIKCVEPWVPPKPGKCPQSPIPFIPCPSVIPEKDRHCHNDQECAKDEKCCPFVCQYLCKKREAVKPGSCPVVNTFAPCKSIEKKCDFDSICPGKQKCCQDGCVIQCVEPWE